MRINFILNRGGVPEGKLADVEIYFDEGCLAGLKLTGLTVWRGNGEKSPYVTFPSRPYHDGERKRFYDYLRSGGSNTGAARDFKGYILEEYFQVAEEQ
ncbi:MAG: hypothetical protein GTO08_09600 [Deltaproteobacteria bacterium]|jgi:hypothetical protein|nr:hypothetical protein [Deltaproteobacteria bacterium]